MKPPAKQGSREPKTPFFFVCSWNVLHGDKWQLKDNDSTRTSVSTLLTALGHQELPDRTPESEADLIVILPRERDRALSIHDLRFYSVGLGGELKKVLYVHAGMEAGFADGPINDWLFVAQRASCHFRTLRSWLASSVPHVEGNARQHIDDAMDHARQRTKHGFDTLLKRWRKAFPRAERGPLSRTGELLLDLSMGNKAIRDARFSPARFYFALCRLANVYGRVEHDINARRAQDVLKDAVKLYYDGCMDFLNSCADFRAALAVCCQVAGYPVHLRKTILLIDDNPTRGRFQETLTKSIRLFLPGFTLWTWNPDAAPVNAENGKGLSRKDVEEYSSWTWPKTDDFLGRQLNVEEGKAAPRTLREVLERTHVVLVDILFQDARGIDHEAGYGLVRGLQRIFRDFQDKMPKGWYIPQVQAVSRASDIEKVHTVYRSGAAGYLLKNRPRSVPGAIARTLQPAVDGVHTAHRNFRALYNLPHATLGELHATCIPSIPFHQPPGVRSKENSREIHKNCRDSRIDHTQALAKLLAVLPKADLHVHPGTCMKPEFLVVASLVMLVRHDLGDETSKTFADFKAVIQDLSKIFGGSELILARKLAVTAPVAKLKIPFGGTPEKIAAVGDAVRNFLANEVRAGERNRRCTTEHRVDVEARYRHLRSVLHTEFKIADHVSAEAVCLALRGLSDAKCFFFALRHCDGNWSTLAVLPKEKRVADDYDDLLRLYLLWLAGDKAYPGSNVVVATPSPADKGKCEDEGKPDETTVDIEAWFRRGAIDLAKWTTLRHAFYGNKDFDAPPCSKKGMESTNWSLMADSAHMPKIEVTLCRARWDFDFLADCPTAKDHPIAWLVASGTRSSNLREYLEGSDYTGAEHMKHPFLMHLFAQQAVYEFIRHGVLYAELRTALSGYANPHLDISFSDACTCFRTAMGQAQQIAQYAYFKDQPPGDERGAPVWLWKNCFAIRDLFNPVADDLAPYRFPCKTSIVLTGKRDKPSRVLLREAGAGAVLHARPVNPAESAIEFVHRAVPECRVVGFDLAGQEDDHPPQLFREEYNQIARMHIPVTAHAGENAPSDFVESAILDLRARRIGHGLALADDKALMDRARDDGTCIELCPVSNFQTNAVYPYKLAKSGREYPLRKFLDAGLNVTINTDNPVVSYTNMVKECFQAAYALGSESLSLWDLMRILRAGFTQSFLTQPERHAVLELADQLVFDLFSRREIVDMLSMMSAVPARTPFDRAAP